MGWTMSATWGGYRYEDNGGLSGPATWENVYDDGVRAELMPYRGELLRLDECGPPPGRDAYVL
jgi:hypothetical protein